MTRRIFLKNKAKARVFNEFYDEYNSTLKPTAQAMDPQLQEKANATLAWFSQFQYSCVIRNGVIPEWFHGIITRKTAEEMLLSKPAGYFLIRVSESRIGFTLSCRAEDRCRHFMIDVLKNGQYNIVGESTNHRSLQDLVAFHRRVPILPNNDLLTVACGQVSKDKTDYAELLFPQRKPQIPTSGAFSTNVLHASNTVQLEPSPNLAPSPTQRPSRSFCGDSSPTVASPTRLYPSLDAEIAKLSVQSPLTTNDVQPIPLPRKSLFAKSVLQEQAPELPSRSFPLNKTEQTSSGPHPLSISRPVGGEAQPNLKSTPPSPGQQRAKGVKSAGFLMHLKRNSQKKGQAPVEHIYTELAQSEHSSTTPSEIRVGKEPVCEHVYQEILESRQTTEPNTSHVDSVPAVLTNGLPEEYRVPPPFAPGY